MMKNSNTYDHGRKHYHPESDGGSTITADIHGMAVLVVDDNVFNQQLVKTLLNSAGVDVTVSCGANDAIVQSKKYRFDAVLMDIQMPEMDGIEATRIIRADTRNADMPIFAMTANATEADISRYISAGMNGTVAKPVHYQSLFDMLISCVRPDNLPATSRYEQSRASNGEDEHFHPETAIARVGSDEVFLHMLDKFIPYYGQSVLKIMVAVTDSDMDEAQRIAHTLKGAAATVGAPLLSDAARKLEIAFSKRESREYSELLERLRGELAIVVVAIENYLDKRH